MANIDHNKKHGIGSSTDHEGVSGAVADNLQSFDASGLPKDSGESTSDLSTLTGGGNANGMHTHGCITKLTKGGENGIPAGAVVYYSGQDGNDPVIKLAKADSATTMPAAGITIESGDLNDDIMVRTYGLLNSTDTQGTAVKDPVYVSAATAGEWTVVKPIGTAKVQKIGTILDVDASGNIEVSGANRVNDIPNIPTNNVWLGDADGVPQEVNFDTEVSDNSDVTTNSGHSATGSGNPHGVTKTEVGLGNVDNTSDVNKPVSTAQQTALDGKTSHSLATAINDFLVASGVGVFVKKTLADVKALLGIGTPAGSPPGTVLYLCDQVIIPPGAGPETITLYRLDAVPCADPEEEDQVTVNASDPYPIQIERYMYDIALGVTAIPAGTWTFSTYRYVDTTIGTTSISKIAYKVVVGAGAVTITGSGTSRTATVAAGTPFVSGDADADPTAAHYLQTPNGVFQITGYTSSAIVTIETLSTYSNESSAAYSVHNKLFSVDNVDINNTDVALDLTNSVQSSPFSLNVTDKLSVAYFGETTRNGNVIITLVHSGSEHASSFLFPLATSHSDLIKLGYSESGHTGFAESGANSSITSLSGLTTPLSEAQGGTGHAAGTRGVRGFLIDGHGEAITPGKSSWFIEMDVPGTLTKINIKSIVDGVITAKDISFDMYKNESKISASDPIDLVGGSQSDEDHTTFDGWSSTTFVAGDNFSGEVTGDPTAEYVVITMFFNITG